jgi:hypothetical protein
MRSIIGNPFQSKVIVPNNIYYLRLLITKILSKFLKSIVGYP